VSLHHLVETYGYWAVLLGTFFEGETVLVLAGLAAHHGYLSLPWVMVTAFVGSLAGDQTWFLIGTRWGPRVIEKRPVWKRRIKRARELLQRRGKLLMVGFRFLYGVRSVTPFAIGMSGVPTRVFTPLNTIGAAIWAVGLGGASYLLGEAMKLALARAHHYELYAMLLIAAGGFALWIWSYVRDRRKRRNSPSSVPDDSEQET